MFTRTLAVAAVLAMGGPAFAQAPPSAEELARLSRQVKLTGPRDEQRVIVLGVGADGRKFDLSRTATIASANAKIAVVEKGIVRPVADGGHHALDVEATGAKATVPVTVTKAAADVPVSFTREIEPILTRAGCNSGACHGAQHRPRRLPAVAVRLRSGLRSRPDRAEQRGPARRA